MAAVVSDSNTPLNSYATRAVVPEQLRHQSRRMHELPVTEKILEVTLKHAQGQHVNRIVRIHLRVGELSDLEPEWIQRYFDYLSKGTLAEGARLAIETSPIVLRCQGCGRSFAVEKDALEGVNCPDCGETGCALVSGREYYVKNMEVV